MNQFELQDDAQAFFQTIAGTMAELAVQISETEDAVGRLIADQGGMERTLSEPLQAIDRISQKLQQIAFCLEAAAEEVEWPDGPPPRLYEVRLLDDLKVLLEKAPVTDTKPTASTSGDVDLFG